MDDGGGGGSRPGICLNCRHQRRQQVRRDLRIIVQNQDVLGPRLQRVGDPDVVPAGIAEVLPRLQYRHREPARLQELDRRVGRRVVDDDHGERDGTAGEKRRDARDDLLRGIPC